jgi:hypothetical protein
MKKETTNTSTQKPKKALGRYIFKNQIDKLFSLPKAQQHEALYEVLSTEEIIKLNIVLHGVLYHKVRSSNKELDELKTTAKDGNF